MKGNLRKRKTYRNLKINRKDKKLKNQNLIVEGLLIISESVKDQDRIINKERKIYVGIFMKKLEILIIWIHCLKN